MKWLGTGNWGMLLLGIWLLITGLAAVFQITFANMGLILGLLALVAGVLILLGR